MRKAGVLLSFLIFISCVMAQARDTGSNFQRFRRLSYILTGKPLSSYHLQEISSLEGNQKALDGLYNEYAQKWVDQEPFADKMKERIDNLFQVKQKIHNNGNLVNTAYDRLVL
ncbi:MAG: hypothetical protein KDD33_13530, partial [Bdellovibrionales bacterium]|nr:hypothetical protein [Bdellovibrionales bacterium]